MVPVFFTSSSATALLCRFQITLVRIVRCRSLGRPSREKEALESPSERPWQRCRSASWELSPQVACFHPTSSVSRGHISPYLPMNRACGLNTHHVCSSDTRRASSASVPPAINPLLLYISPTSSRPRTDNRGWATRWTTEREDEYTSRDEDRARTQTGKDGAEYN